MSVPKKRRTKSAVCRNRANLALKSKTLNNCSQCGQAVLPHTACSFCGNYKNRTVLNLKDKKNKTKNK
jgi:large subunit ribosomal protein L32